MLPSNFDGIFDGCDGWEIYMNGALFCIIFMQFVHISINIQLHVKYVSSLCPTVSRACPKLPSNFDGTSDGCDG